MQQRSGNVDPLGDRATASALERVKNGMKVVDASGHDIGKIAFVKMGDAEAATLDSDDTRPREGVVAGPSSAVGGSGGVGVVALPVGTVDSDFAGDVPEPIQARLLRKGYVKIAGGFLFGKDRYVFADQIASVDNDVVKLTVNKEGLTV